MDAKISPSFWNNDALSTPELLLTALWMRTNSFVNLVGYCDYNVRRFVFDTRLPAEALPACFEALGKGLQSDTKGFWLRSYIAENFGRGPSLYKNNMASNLRKLIGTVQCDWLATAIHSEYPELFCDSHGITIPEYKGLGKGLVRGQPKCLSTRVEKRRAEKSRVGMGVQGERTGPPAIYEAYPKHVGRKDALKAIADALHDHSFDFLVERTHAFASAVATWPPERRRFVPHPATWFRRGSFEDDPSTWQAEPAKNSFGGGASTQAPISLPSDAPPEAFTGGLKETPA